MSQLSRIRSSSSLDASKGRHMFALVPNATTRALPRWVFAAFTATAIALPLTVTTSAAAAPSAGAQLTEKLATLNASMSGLGESHAGPRWREQRDAILLELRASPALRQTLESRVANAAYTADSFEADTHAAILLAHLTTPDAVSELDALQGLTPTHYLKRRRARAGAVAELVRRNVPAPLLYERLAYTFDKSQAQVSTLNAFPDAVKDQAPGFIAQEQFGQEEALLHALSESGHALAPQALTQWLRGKSDASMRATTVLALGTTRSPLALDVLLNEIESGPRASQEAATVALGRLRTLESARQLAVLVEHSSVGENSNSPSSGAIRVAAIRALAVSGSTRLRDGDASARTKIASAALVGHLSAAMSEREAAALVESLAQLATRETVDALQASKAPLATKILRRIERSQKRRR